MKNSWRNNIAVLILSAISISTAHSKNVPEKPKYKCLNVGVLGWRIVQRLSANTYEIITRESTPQMEAQSSILIAVDDRFETTGRLPTLFWTEDDGKTEMREVVLQNGFKKKLHVIRESAACAYWQGLEIKEDEVREEAKQKIRQQKEREEQESNAKTEKEAEIKRRQKQKEADSLWKE